jgi:hypothetical protein
MRTDSSDKDRFLIALAKFLGENPTKEKPLAGVQISEEWFIDELLRPLLPGDGKVSLTFEKFNQLMLASGRRIATTGFYGYFFQTVSSVAEFESAVEKFRVKAMWLFGNFQFAYKQLATSEPAKFRHLIDMTTVRGTEMFDGREPFHEVESIAEQDLKFLGYLSGQRLDDFDSAVKTLRLAIEQWDGLDEVLSNLGPERRAKLAEVLAREHKENSDLAPERLKQASRERVVAETDELEPKLKEQRKRQADAQATGLKNTQRYLTLPYLDVYVATSMREDEDFINQHKFVKDVFGSEHVKDLKLRYFDPTASYDPDRIKKGLIECLMLRRASVTIYSAGAEDTMGKDSELAATLAQGKPVIVYVPSEPRFVELPSRKQRVDMDRRAKAFRVDHPLGLQTSAQTGVAHGIVVVRSVDQCAKMLRKVLLHDLELSIQHEGGNFLLREAETQSILRVVTDDPMLSHSFWTYFRHTQPEPDI